MSELNTTQPPQTQGGIYVITNLENGKRYVGQTANFSKRKSRHFSDLRKGTHSNKYLQASYNKHGEDNFKFEVKEVCPEEILNDKDAFDNREQLWLDMYKSMGAETYNIGSCVGGPMKGVKVSDETRQKLSEAKRGENNTSFGKKPSDETRQKISEAMKGKSPSLEARQKMSENSGKSKKVLCHQTCIVYSSAREASRQLFGNLHKVSAYLAGNTKKTNGLTFEFVQTPPEALGCI